MEDLARRLAAAGGELIDGVERAVETVLRDDDEIDPEEPRYIPAELLLTFTSGTAMPQADDPRVLRLLTRAEEIAGIGGHGWSLDSEGGIEARERAVEAEESELERRENISGGDDAASERQEQALEAREEQLEAEERERTGDQPGKEWPGQQPQLPLTLRLPLPADGRPVEGRDPVKVAVDRINGALGSLQDGGIAVSSAMPNWILSGARGHAGGGPGTSPDPAPPGSWQFTVPDAGRWHEGVDEAPAQAVIVAILDSWPGEQSLIDARNKNALMHRLAAPDAITVWECPALSPQVPKRFTYANADHGLFVAGIIASIAPRAELHLLHVLNEQGLGSTDRLLCALGECLRLAQSGQRVVVNMSLYLLIPPDDAPLTMWDVWFKDDPGYHRRTPQQNAALLELLDEPVEQAMTLLLDAGAVVVAAAGNDAIAFQRHAQPRLPADYDTALCVVATDSRGSIARYSNRADVPMTGNCVATWGGQGVQSGPHVVVPPAPPEPRDGVVSLYSQPLVAIDDGSGAAPAKGTPNASGWVYWSGTSFATPIISAIAANVLAKNERAHEQAAAVPHLTPRGVMGRILAMADPPPDPAVGCKYLPVSQAQGAAPMPLETVARRR